MANELPQFETQDRDGSTSHHNGTATSGAVGVPSVAAGFITEVLMTVPKQAGSAAVKISFDGGTNYIEVKELGHIVWPMKGDITQVFVKTDSGSFDYEIILNRESP